jgi:competence protein ComEC
MVVLDVGQGDAVMIEMPRGRNVLIDAGVSWGGTSGGDAGARVIVPYLRSRGVNGLDALVVTHGHRDHYGGAPSVMRACRPRVVVLPTGYETSDGLRETAQAAESLGVRVKAVASGDTLVSTDSCRLVVLSPPRRPRKRDEAENDRSVIVRAELGHTVTLLTGDAQAAAEIALLDRPRLLRGGILKVAHHGSGTSSTPDFLRAVSPGLAVISVGQGNRYGHPDASVVERLRGVGAAVLRTDLDGAVLIDVMRDRAVARGFASGERQILFYGSPQGDAGPTTTVE